jgi:hypothetical protein
MLRLRERQPASAVIDRTSANSIAKSELDQIRGWDESEQRSQAATARPLGHKPATNEAAS